MISNNILVIQDSDLVAYAVERYLRPARRPQLSATERGEISSAVVALEGTSGTSPAADGHIVILTNGEPAGGMESDSDPVTRAASLLQNLCTVLQRVQPRTADAPPSRSYPSAGSHVISVGSCQLNTHTYEFSSPHVAKTRLTPVQFDLLYHLMRHAGEVFSTARLLDEVWDYPNDSGSPDLVRVHIKNLRQRIERDPSRPVFLKTVNGFGYTVQPATVAE